MITSVIEFEDGRIATHNSPSKHVGKTFERGFLTAYMDSNGNIVINRESLPEVHKPFPSIEANEVLVASKSFFGEGIREKVNALGFTHKLGILLHGRQGTGKTSLINYIASQMIDKLDAICILCDNSDYLGGGIALAKQIRSIQDNPIIFLCDEFERFADRSESEMKNFLDGKDSVDNMLFLASTNYLEKVPNTLKDRPSRFRLVREIKGINDSSIIAKILRDTSSKVDPPVLSDKEIEELSKQTPKTLDEVKSMVLEKVTSFIPADSNRRSAGFKMGEEELII